jgi:hypothetical protein
MTQMAWREAYKDALMEVDPAKLSERVEAAHKAIHERLNEEGQPLSKREFDDIDGALRTLRFLLKEAA